ncbi:hypothetical protein CW304_20235 [Bacillus sp. UFRGS-B20]|nr:hypothetical protein CW304_20235 [Bacillus sp. UFRGS-B20]
MLKRRLRTKPTANCDLLEIPKGTMTKILSCFHVPFQGVKRPDCCFQPVIIQRDLVIFCFIVNLFEICPISQ